MTPLDKAIKIIGNQRELANYCGCSQQSVSLWKKKGYVPRAKAVLIEQAVKGAISRYDLVYPPSQGKKIQAKD